MTDESVWQQSESSGIEKSSGISPAIFTAVMTWVTTICNHKRLELPDKTTMRLTWLEPVSCFPLAAIHYAFRDYLRNGAGEWFDVHAITRRCHSFCDAEEGKSQKNFIDQLDEWKRHKAEHPEQYVSGNYVEIMAHLVKEAIASTARAGTIAGANMSAEQWEERKRLLREQAREITNRTQETM